MNKNGGGNQKNRNWNQNPNNGNWNQNPNNGNWNRNSNNGNLNQNPNNGNWNQNSNNGNWNQNQNNGNWNQNSKNDNLQQNANFGNFSQNRNNNWNQNQKRRADNQNWNNGAGNQNAGAKKKKQNNPQNPPRAHPIREANKRNPILMGKQGFSITYNSPEYKQINPTKSFGAEAVDLLNKYADKIYRTEGKTCYFTQKLTDIPPVFIETDIPDPSVIVNAIFEDLLLPLEERLVKDSEKMVSWSNFIPVHKTCLYEPEIMLQTAKDVLRPVFLEQPVAQPLKYKLNLKKCKIIGKQIVKTLEEELDKFLRSSSTQHKAGFNASGKPDVEVVMVVTGNTCWISLLRQLKRFKDYSVSGINTNKHFVVMPEKKTKTEEEKKEERLKCLMNKLSRAQSEEKIRKLKMQIEEFKAEMAAESTEQTCLGNTSQQSSDNDKEDVHLGEALEEEKEERKNKHFVAMPHMKKKTEEEKKEERLKCLMNKLSRAQSEKKIRILKLKIEQLKTEMAAESTEQTCLGNTSQQSSANDKVDVHLGEALKEENDTKEEEE